MAALNRIKLDPTKPLVFARRTLYKGETYQRGDEVPEQKDLAKATVEKLFRGGFVKNGEVTKKPVEQPNQPVETPSESPSQDPVPETTSEDSSTTYTPKKRGRKPSKSKSE